MKKVMVMISMATFLIASVPCVTAANVKYNTTITEKKHKKDKVSKSKTASRKKAETNTASPSKTTQNKK